MGTPMAPNYANIFMTKFETELIESYHQSTGVKPLIWFRYIDDIFFIWCDGPEKLSEFLEYAQKFSDSREMKSKIKFEVHQSTESVNFLDVKVRLNGTTIETTLYSKPTDAHMYLNTSSNHPKHVIRNIPKGQFIRIRRICSNLDEYKRNSSILSEFLVKRGYNRKSLESAISEVSAMDRKDLLLDKERPKKDPQIIFVSEWHPSLSKLPAILKKHYHLLQSDQNLSEVFPEPPSVAFRRPKSIRNHLIRGDILPTRKEPTCTKPCGKNCKICKSLSSATEIANPKVKNTTQKIKHFGSCDSRNLIYAVRCKKCNELYVGHTGEKLQDRMSKHRYDCKRRPDNTELSAHFHRKKHDPEKDMEIFILQTGLKTVEEREFYEDRWICLLQTLQPKGINKEVHPYAQSMYKCFKDIL